MRHEQQDTEEHGSLIKTPKQLIVTVILAFLVPIIVILLLVNVVASGVKTGAGSESMTPQATSQRIAPVAKFELVDANAPRVLQSGEQVYKSTCFSCHASGTAGAPVVGDEGSWAKYIKEGYEAMLEVALKGKGAMPPKGGNPALDDLEVARAVVYMANQSGGSFDEPAEPAPAEGEQEGGKPAEGGQADAQPAGGQAAQAGAQQQQPQQAAAPAVAKQPTTTPTEGASGSSAEATVNPAGEKLYKTTCFACHGTGVAGAPKFGDKAAWSKYIETGEDAMLQVVLKGKGAMPPKGGAANASEDDLRAAVRYMVNAVK